MRYQNWDVLMFPHELCKIPMQEFKTSCQVVQDHEVHYSQTTALILPMVTCFIPSLAAGEPFRISIHSWQNPEASRYVQHISNRNAEYVMFEARVFVDGQIAGTKLFHRNGPWPTVLETSVGNKIILLFHLYLSSINREIAKNSSFLPSIENFYRKVIGTRETTLGRVKVVVSEGIPRDNIFYAFERIKNLVAFSFQHAPLDVLEASSIAWPNAAMWRQVSLVAPIYNQHPSPKRVEEDHEAHAHSPRKSQNIDFLSSQSNSMPPPAAPFSKPPNSTHSLLTHTSCLCRLASDSSGQAGIWAHTNLSVKHYWPPVPVNTPQNESEMTSANIISLRQTSLQRVSSRVGPVDRVTIPRAIGALDAPEGLVSHIEEARLRDSRRLSSSSLSCANKENESRSPAAPSESTGLNNQRTASDGSTRRTSNLFTSTNAIGTKRQRNVTPASSKAIDDEDEPRSSPSLRKVSRQSNASGNGRGKDAERRVLSTVDNA
ncbi:uncharacterized protein EAF02_009260 [Botrytis sinoallii]|uniref:uncharacterized protein n=1 Tax=Botrytis sinoallii TaxID=1463999 RepID=UPI001901F1BF|nr:uncharacterized protein EAF02_009260 [Botrytis sinoallii]KAF7870070.1 hypothetical protein EAF02_009260 [Botrytis sinoallii]